MNWQKRKLTFRSHCLTNRGFLIVGLKKNFDKGGGVETMPLPSPQTRAWVVMYKVVRTVKLGGKHTIIFFNFSLKKHISEIRNKIYINEYFLPTSRRYCVSPRERHEMITIGNLIRTFITSGGRPTASASHRRRYNTESYYYLLKLLNLERFW